MKRLVLFAAVAGLSTLMGTRPVSAKPAKPLPAIAILSPKSGTILHGRSLTVRFAVKHFLLVAPRRRNPPALKGNRGHIQVTVDNRPFNTAVDVVASTTHTWSGLPNGYHVLTAYLANNQYAPIPGGNVATVSFTIAPLAVHRSSPGVRAGPTTGGAVALTKPPLNISLLLAALMALILGGLVLLSRGAASALRGGRSAVDDSSELASKSDSAEVAEPETKAEPSTNGSVGAEARESPESPLSTLVAVATPVDPALSSLPAAGVPAGVAGEGRSGAITARAYQSAGSGSAPERADDGTPFGHEGEAARPVRQFEWHPPASVGSSEESPAPEVPESAERVEPVEPAHRVDSMQPAVAAAESPAGDIKTQALNMAGQLASVVEGLVGQLEREEQKRGQLETRVAALEESARKGDALRQMLHEASAESLTRDEVNAVQFATDSLVRDPDHIVVLASVSQQAARLQKIVNAYARIRRALDE